MKSELKPLISMIQRVLNTTSPNLLDGPSDGEAMNHARKEMRALPFIESLLAAESWSKRYECVQ